MDQSPALAPSIHLLSCNIGGWGVAVNHAQSMPTNHNAPQLSLLTQHAQAHLPYYLTDPYLSNSEEL